MAGGRRFCMGDIHGTLDALLECLSAVNFDYNNDTLIQLGDVVDRHDNSYECIEELLKIKNLISIKGNHDDWWYEYLKTGEHHGEWKHGGLATLASYSRNIIGEDWKYPSFARYRALKLGVPQDHLDFFENQVNYVIIDRMLFVHGGFDKTRMIDDQVDHTYYWDRKLWENACLFDAGVRLESEFKYIDDRFDYVIVGHCALRDGVPRKAVNVFNIDTYCGGSGRLTIMDIDTKEFWQSKFQP